MAKELMEIGGFITSGAEIVNHDNSLSGNGTVDSPLGLNSGYQYNETVLCSGSTPVSSLSFSESRTNFERLKVLMTTEPNVTSKYMQWFEFDNSVNQWNIILGAGDSNAWFNEILLRADNNGISALNRKAMNFASFTNSSTVTSIPVSITVKPEVLKAVIGVNRIANS